MSTSLLRILQDNFKIFKTENEDILKRINDYTYFHKYNIFTKYGFHFIKFTDAPFIFLSKYYIFENIGNDIELKQPEDKSTIITLKDAFHTWILTKSEEKKAIYAEVILALLKDEKYSNNISLKFIAGIIYTYDKRNQNYLSALSHYNEIQELILKDNENKYNISNKSEFLCFVNLLAGFVSLLSNNLYSAKEYFEKANQLDRNQITPKFYLNYAEILLGNQEKIKDLFYLCLNYDIQIMYDYLIAETTQPIIFYLERCVTYEIFFHKELETFSKFLESMVIYEKERLSRIYSLIFTALEELKKSDLKNFITQKAETTILFIDNYIKNFKDNYNIILLHLTYQLIKKIEEIRNEILEEVKNSILKKVETRLYPIEHQLQVKTKSISDLNTSKADEISNLKTEKQLKMIEKDKEIDLQVLKYENMLNDMDNLTKYNPKLVFTNSIIYSVILSMLVFIIFSFYNCSSSNDMGNIGSGLATSLITFLIASFFSALLAMYAYFEKITYSRKLKSKIKYLSENKSKLIEQVADDFDRKIQEIDEFYTNKIKKLKDDIEKLNNDKKRIVEETLQSHQKTIDAVKDKIDEIISHISM